MKEEKKREQKEVLQLQLMSYDWWDRIVIATFSGQTVAGNAIWDTMIPAPTARWEHGNMIMRAVIPLGEKIHKIKEEKNCLYLSLYDFFNDATG